ncbi:MAG: hypothetical protein HN351_01015 [Deltaproteobacteria bacterium]|nr:hypothetical protein [Deltaproteobacteria bacterium]
MLWLKKKNLKNYCLHTLFISGVLLSAISVSAQETYLDELLPGTKTSFKHWDVQRAEISGYSHFSYEAVTKDTKKFIVERNENTRADGEVFTRKTLWFAANSGVPEWYEEEDLREDFRIKNSYSGQIMRTRLEKAGKVLEFETNLSQENAVPFEVVIFFLRKNLQHILQTKDYSFTLFLPLLAIELEEKGLPRSMSMIRMKVEPQEELSLETPLGKMKARKILVLPKSGFLRALLPRDKTHFEFTIAEAAPHYLLEFTAGKTRHILTQLSLTQ